MKRIKLTIEYEHQYVQKPPYGLDFKSFFTGSFKSKIFHLKQKEADLS